MRRLSENHQIRGARSLVVALVVGAVLSRPVASADTASQVTAPPTVTARSGSEYYPINGEALLLLPVHVWGEVRDPGVHYVRPGKSIAETISVAGGPNVAASLPDVKLVRGNTVRYVDLFDRESALPIEANDRLIVETSFKQNMPLLFTGISTLASIATLYLVARQNR